MKNPIWEIAAGILFAVIILLVMIAVLSRVRMP